MYISCIEAMPRTTKKQINIKMPTDLIDALKTKAEDKGDTFTDLVIRFCSEGLGIKSDRPQTSASPFEPEQLDERIADKLAPLQERLVALELELGELSA
jgi:hypothetical protein